MPRYAITERAGPFVAGIRNTGVGTVLELTERQAEHELRLGALVRLPEPDEGTAVEPRESVAAEHQADPAAVTSASLELSTAPAGDHEPDAPAPSRKQKRSAT